MRGVRGPKSTVPSSAILVGSVATEWSYRALGTLTPGLSVPWGAVGGGGVGASARPGPYAGSMSFLFIIVPFLVGPLSLPKSHVSFPKRRSQRGVVVSRALATLVLLPQTWPFIGPTRLKQTFDWLIKTSRDFR